MFFYLKIMNKYILIFSVFVVASCGLAYELIMGALSSYVLGDSILHFSTIIGTYLFAMGVGAAISKYIKDEKLIDNFINIEIAIGILGGISAILLTLTFLYFAISFKTLLYFMVFFIGFLVGMEIPIVIRLLYLKEQELRNVISNVLSFDYLGALFVSLLFPLFFMPYFGIHRTAILFGFSNLGVAFLGSICFLKEKNKRNNRIFVILLSLLFLMGVFAYSESISNYAEKGVYGDEIIFSKNTKYQKIFVTKHKNDIRLFINGNLQFSTKDEHRYHEALVHPILQAHPNPKNVLVLGGGDGLAVRELLTKEEIEKITLVDLDEDMTHIFKNNELLKKINKNSLTNSKVSVINEDAAKWLEKNEDFYDLIIVDFPDPSNYSLGKLYSTSFYSLLKKRLSFNGYGTIQSTSPYFAPNVYWTIYSTLKEVGFEVNPYHVYVPSFGDWGFFIISNNKYEIPKIKEEEFKYLTNQNLKEMFEFPKDMPKLDLEPNKLTNQTVVEKFQQDWENIH